MTPPDNTYIEYQEITPRVTVGHYPAYYDLKNAAIALDNFIVVFDPLRFPRNFRDFQKTVEKKYKLPVTYLFISHVHGDHVFGIEKEFDGDIFGTRVLKESIEKRWKDAWTTKAFQDWIETDAENAELIKEIEYRPLDFTFETHYEITDGDLRLEFHYSGGHTACSGWAYFPAEKVVIAGDELFSHCYPSFFDGANPDRWIKFYRDVLSLDAEIFVPGHGSVCDRDEIEKQLDLTLKLKESALKIIESGKTHNDIVSPDFYEPLDDGMIESAKKIMYEFYSLEP